MKRKNSLMNLICKCFTFLLLNHHFSFNDAFPSLFRQQRITGRHHKMIARSISSNNKAKCPSSARQYKKGSFTNLRMKNLNDNLDSVLAESSINTTDATSESTIIAHENSNSDTYSISVADYTLGTIILLTVPCAWGTFAPVVRFVYELEIPFPGFLFSAGYYTIASLTLNLILFAQHFLTLQKDDDTVDGISSTSSKTLSPWEHMPINGGFELGGYLFIGNCLQVVGLETVSADRAAFLVQLTTVFVPLLQASFFLLEDDSNGIKKNIFEIIPVQTWAACILAFFGVIVMGFDDGSTSFSEISIAQNGIPWEFISHSLSSFSSIGIGIGDFLVLAAAVSYTFHVVRLSKYAQYTTPLKLACSKATFEAIFSIFLVVVLVNSASFTTQPSIASMGQEITRFLDAYGSGGIPLPAIFACLWTGWVTCAYTIYAQSFGQKRIRNPTFANLIYSTQPLFSAGFAWLLLEEKLGAWGYVGGGLICIALSLITLTEQKSRDAVTEVMEPLA